MWNKEEYKKIVNELINLKDQEYKDFHKSLVLNSKYEMIGVRVPIVRDIAKKISKTNILEFLKYSEDNYYEEVLLQGFIISYIKDEEVFDRYFNEYIRKIDNWAICDSFCNSIKIVRKNEDKYFNEALSLSLSKNEFISRVGLIIILNNFINEKNLSIIFKNLNKIQSDKFYINMAEAWLICEMYIKYPNETLKFIKNNKLNKFTQNKSISKIRDSYRVSKEQKEILESFKK